MAVARCLLPPVEGISSGQHAASNEQSMRYWLSRFAFSLVVLACVLVWQIHRGTQAGTLSGARQGLYIAAAVVCFSLGVAGMKERHRRDHDA